jgi:thiol-disulfide isomerase/thioredoxin
MFPHIRAFVVLFLASAFLFGIPNVADAEALDLSLYKGKVVYLDFWASWCNPCRQSFPWMNQIQSIYAQKGLVVIGVNVDHDPELAKEFLQANFPQFKIVYDSGGKIAGAFNFKNMPSSFLIGRDGKIRYVHSGFFPSQERAYVSDIVTLLNEKAP